MLHAGGDHTVPILDGLEDRLGDEPGTVSRQCFKPGGLKDHVPRFGKTFILKGADDALREGHVVMDTTEGKFIAVLILLDKTPATTAHWLKGLEACVQAI